MENSKFKKDDKIIYQYTHHLNRKSTIEIAKTGIFIRYVKRKNPDYFNRKKVVVMLERNKNTSTVFEKDIRHKK